jgi:hypothetical protein
MNRDDIIKLYEKANGWSPATFQKTMDELERFAALVVKAELRRLQEEVTLLRGDPGNRYAHRLAIELECALLAPEQANADLLDEYHTAVREWMEANGQPYVSGFGKD